MSMQVEAHNACEWRELHEVLELKDGFVYRTRDTGTHILACDPAPYEHIKVPISALPGTTVTITNAASTN